MHHTRVPSLVYQGLFSFEMARQRFVINRHFSSLLVNLYNNIIHMRIMKSKPNWQLLKLSGVHVSFCTYVYVYITT